MLDRLIQALTGRAPRPAVQPAPPPVAGATSMAAPAGAAGAAGPEPQPIIRRVLSVIHDPVVDGGSGRRLSEVMGWHDPDALAADYGRDVHAAGHGLVEYQIAERVEVDSFPRKADGFCYDAETYSRCWRAGAGFHQPDAVDYHALLRQFDVVDKVNAGVVDEVWLFGFPYAGYYESLMVGPGAFWCNSPPLELPGPAGALAGPPSPPCRRRFVVMGFNYERDVGCMLENLGHRAESIMARVYASIAGDDNLWEWFSRYDRIAPGQASVGTMHFAPNSRHDYDWGNPEPVLSDCDDWLRFPHLTGERRLVDCRTWGHGDMRRHHLWWFERLPHGGGQTRGTSHNWWTYVADPNQVG